VFARDRYMASGLLPIPRFGHMRYVEIIERSVTDALIAYGGLQPRLVR
jgi:hypothetical protein